jgi:membrane-bound ClpP family serine protease
VKTLGPLAAILACCGVKLLLLGAVLVPAGFLTSNVIIGLAGVAVAALLLAFAVRSRRRCRGACHVPHSADTAGSASGAPH